jgi:isoleucyl-tRNA synthetase
MSNFKPVSPKAVFPSMEEEVLKFWKEQRIFDKTLDKTKNGKPFVFFEGPPTANGKPGIHHVEARSFKDIIPRFQTMKGRYVYRKAGWDTHGLPVELQVEKKLGISGKKQIESIKPTVRESIIEFNRLCKESVWEYKEDWSKLTERMGFWVDLSNPYITYHNSYIESAWWVLKQIWDKGLVYLGHKVVPYCPRCGTALSSHEVAQGYKKVKETSVYMKFKVVNQPARQSLGAGGGDTFILSWTTTPWTLPGNVGLAVGKDIDYIKVKVGDEIWILADAAAEKVLSGTEYEKLEEKLKGEDLIGWEYEPLFEVAQLKSEKSYKVYPADFVTTTDGTGVVHTAVMYGEEDYQLGEQVGLPKFHTVDEAGRFIDAVPDLAGRFAKDKETEKVIFDHLEKNNNLLRTEQYEHDYPFCWRCDTALLYYARDSWFIKMSQFRNQLLENNEQINWVPNYIKHGRFGEWLSEVKDWAISRERYWGTPLPIWTCTKCGKHQVIESIKDLGLARNSFFFTRHGEAENNVLGLSICYPEPKKYHLTEKGKLRAKIMAEKIRAMGGVDMIFTSDITRTLETAQIVGEYLNVPVQTDERLREINIGVYNGRPVQEYWRDWPVEKRWEDAPEGGETHKELQHRMVGFIKDIDKQYKDKKILVVSHGDPLWLLQQYYRSEKGYPDHAEVFSIDVSVHDLHRPYIDEYLLACRECGGEAKRVSAVMDVWFDSGVMPYAQWHYPFDNKARFMDQFPADYISEAIDQTRGWFYTLLAISTLLDMGPAYKNVINVGHILDDKGQKMSKSKGNIVDPWTIINKHGVDALRWYMYSINQPGDNKLFTERDVELVVRKNFLTLWNVLSFLTTYASYDKWEPKQQHNPSTDLLDEWVSLACQDLVNNVTDSLEKYDVFKAARIIEDFINELSTWYVRRSRERKGPEFYQTLYYVLKKLAKLIAPFVPFLAENIWQVLRLDTDEESVHLADWPETRELEEHQKNLLSRMQLVRKLVETGHSIRKAAGIKVRQPLASIRYQAPEKLDQALEEILADELNVKKAEHTIEAIDGSVEFDTNITPELKQEGLSRELARIVQDMRKKSGLRVGEWVNLFFETEDEEMSSALSLLDKKKTFVLDMKRETIENMETFEIDGKKLGLGIRRS